MTDYTARTSDGPTHLEITVRLAAFQYLGHLPRLHGEALPHAALIGGFIFDGRRVPLLCPQGIFKPQLLEFPLSITMEAPTPHRPRPYHGGGDNNGLIRYRYRGGEASSRIKGVVHACLP